MPSSTISQNLNPLSTILAQGPGAAGEVGLTPDKQRTVNTGSLTTNILIVAGKEDKQKSLSSVQNAHQRSVQLGVDSFTGVNLRTRTTDEWLQIVA